MANPKSVFVTLNYLGQPDSADSTRKEAEQYKLSADTIVEYFLNVPTVTVAVDSPKARNHR